MGVGYAPGVGSLATFTLPGSVQRGRAIHPQEDLSAVGALFSADDPLQRVGRFADLLEACPQNDALRVHLVPRCLLCLGEIEPLLAHRALRLDHGFACPLGRPQPNGTPSNLPCEERPVVALAQMDELMSSAGSSRGLLQRAWASPARFSAQALARRSVVSAPAKCCGVVDGPLPESFSSLRAGAARWSTVPYRIFGIGRDRRRRKHPVRRGQSALGVFRCDGHQVT